MKTTDNLVKNLGVFSSFHPPIENTTPEREPSNLKELYELITHKEFKEFIDKQKKLRTKKKEIYPFVTFSGVFSKRSNHNLLSHSGLIVIDIDKCEGNIYRLKEEICKILAVALAFISPSGNGLKVVLGINIDKASHIQYFKWLTIFFKEHFDIEIDKSGSDVSRACFLNYDPEAYFYQDYIGFEPSDFKESKIIEETESYVSDNLDIKKVQSCINQLLEKDIDITENYNDWVRIGFSLASLGEDGRELFHQISSVYPDYDNEECDTQFDNCLNSSNRDISLGTFFYYCKQEGINYQIDSKPKNKPETPHIRSANQRLEDAKYTPELSMLFGHIWFHPEIHILFANTGIGKSILATQLGDSISRGIRTFNLANENRPLNTLFIDFELSDKMFEKRYTDDNTKEPYRFANNFFIDEIDISDLSNSDKKKGFDLTNIDEKLLDLIKKQIELKDISVLIVDNITYLKNLSTQDGQVALSLMKSLKSLKNDYDVSILVIAHTPKIEEGIHLTINHLGGSKNIANFADSISVIGKSAKGENLRYLKQIKVRNGKNKFHSGSVIELRLAKKGNFLGFEPVGFGKEKDHLYSVSKSKNKELKEKALKLKKEGISNRKIAEKLGKTHTTINKWLKDK
ncbi:AAA family ATPase [Aquimarina sp. U1-2]|uniref:BT4734/BF3469 family protein n=1 Tax=Aquimarina sp. U1-2 TaxID=2823141 RepID=UPI001AEC804D|nr:BT4734/BF3469 family protein [Aquimarina sp. U1-2]MBP2833818.1 AAA family ATPase [Aquimarina sp. U1-2]